MLMSRLAARLDKCNDHATNRSECPIGSDSKSGYRRSSRVIHVDIFAVRGDGIPAVSITKGVNALADCGDRTVRIDGVGRNAREIGSAWLVFRNDQGATQRKHGVKDAGCNAVIDHNRPERAIGIAAPA